LKKFQEKDLEANPGCTVEETLEKKLSGVLSNVREDLSSKCLTTLKQNHNAALIMAICGSKGSQQNVCQMAVCLAQQLIDGDRVVTKKK
jgi:DNA-directed RNA polymerase III subunit RPC1